MFSTAVVAEEVNPLGSIVKFKHKINVDDEKLVVHVLANDIGSDDPRPVALWLSDDPTLEGGDQFLTEELISDYGRAPGMIGMPVLTKLTVIRPEDLQGKFAIITIGTARDVFQTGDQSLTIVRQIGRPECVSDLFKTEDEPNDEEEQGMNLGSLKQEYCVEVNGAVLSDGLGRELRDLDRYRLRVKESLAIESVLTHPEDLDFSLAVVTQSDGEIMEFCETMTSSEPCRIEFHDVEDPVDLEFMVIPEAGTGLYSLTLRGIDNRPSVDSALSVLVRE